MNNYFYVYTIRLNGEIFVSGGDEQDIKTLYEGIKKQANYKTLTLTATKYTRTGTHTTILMEDTL